MTAGAEIKAPSRKEAAEIYLKVAGEDARQIDFQNFMRYGIRTPRPRTDFSINDLTPEDRLAIGVLRQAGYSEHAAAFEKDALAKLQKEWNEGDPLRKPYLAELKKRGYNAVIDENDANWTNKPLIIVDPESVIGAAKGRRLTPVDKVVATYLK